MISQTLKIGEYERVGLLITYAVDISDGANTRIESYYRESDVAQLSELVQDKTKFVKIGNLDLPITTNLFEWGKIFAHEDNIVKIVKPYSNLIYVVNKNKSNKIFSTHSTPHTKKIRVISRGEIIIV